MNKKIYFFSILILSFIFSHSFAQILDQATIEVLYFLNTIYIFVIRLTIIVSILRIIWGGITYLFALGEITSVNEAKNMIVDAILGLIVVLTSYSFLSLLGLQPP